MGDDPVPRSLKGHTCIRKSKTSTLYMAKKPTRTQDQTVSESNSNQISKITFTSIDFGTTASTAEKEECG